MKVSELITALQGCDPDATVVTSDCCNGYDFEPKVKARMLYREADSEMVHKYEGWIAEEAATGRDMSWLYDEPIEIFSVVEVD